jgi:hypothetical protein
VKISVRYPSGICGQFEGHFIPFSPIPNSELWACGVIDDDPSVPVVFLDSRALVTDSETGKVLYEPRRYFHLLQRAIRKWLVGHREWPPVANMPVVPPPGPEDSAKRG